MKKILILFTLVMIAALFGSIAFADPALAEPFTWSMLLGGGAAPALTINASTLGILKRAFNAAFKKGFGSPTSLWQKVATLVPSSTRTNDYGWLGKIPGMREWIGDRQINNLKLHSYSIQNKSFESTISVDRDDIDDDQYGQYTPMMEMLGQNAAEHPDELVFALLAAGFETTCYDGQYFFDTDHPVIDADGNETSVSNMQAGTGNPWFLLDTRRPLKPLIYQERKKAEFVAMDNPDDQSVFTKKEYQYGVDSRCNVGFAFWQMAFGSKAELTATNFDDAMSAMGSIPGDYGKKLALQPVLLVVGPSNRAAAKAVIEAERNAAGASNTNYKAVEVLVVPWLD